MITWTISFVNRSCQILSFSTHASGRQCFSRLVVCAACKNGAALRFPLPVVASLWNFNKILRIFLKKCFTYCGLCAILTLLIFHDASPESAWGKPLFYPEDIPVHDVVFTVIFAIITYFTEGSPSNSTYYAVAFVLFYEFRLNLAIVLSSGRLHAILYMQRIAVIFHNTSVSNCISPGITPCALSSIHAGARVLFFRHSIPCAERWAQLAHFGKICS